MAESEIIFKSNRPDVDIPEVPLTDYILDGLSEDVAEKPALIDGVAGRKYTFGQLKPMIYKCANTLKSHGFQKGDVLAIHAPNLPEYPIIFHGCLALGGTVTTSNPLYKQEELHHQFELTKPKFLVTIPNFKDVSMAVAKETSVEKVFVLGEGDSLFASEDMSKPEVEINPKEHIAVIPFSSGTSGLPKGVMLTHHNIVSNIAQLTSDADSGADIRSTDVVLAVLPFFHIYGMTVICSVALKTRATSVVIPKFEPQGFLTLIQTYKISFVPLVPPILLFLAKHPVVEKFDLSSVRVFLSGAAPLDPELTLAASKRLNAEVRQGYGMTEMSPASHVSSPVKPVVPGSCGILLANTEAKLVDPETKKSLGSGPDNRGELCIRGPQVMKGYFQNEAATKECLDEDGFLHTGDIAYVDDEGNYFIVDRLKELIKVKGFQVPPAELEGVLLENPVIADCAVIGKPDERAGEVPIAFVVLKPDAKDASAEEIKAHVASKVAAYKQLAEVRIVESIPKSASGKILKRVLKEQLKAELAKK